MGLFVVQSSSLSDFFLHGHIVCGLVYRANRFRTSSTRTRRVPYISKIGGCLTQLRLEALLCVAVKWSRRAVGAMYGVYGVRTYLFAVCATEPSRFV